MAQAKNSKGGKDNFTRNLVIAVVIGVVLIMLVPTILSKQTDTSAAVPSSVSVEDGYGMVFNKELQDVPFIEIYEDFQCQACARFEAIVGEFIQFHKLLYANQPSENSGAWSAGYFSTLSLGLGIQSKDFDKCIANNEYKGWVTNVANEGAKRNINSTPTVFINGKEIDRNTAYNSLGDFMLAVSKA